MPAHSTFHDLVSWLHDHRADLTVPWRAVIERLFQVAGKTGRSPNPWVSLTPERRRLLFTDLEVEAADHLAVVLPATESTPGRFPRPGELAAVAKALTHTESLARDIVPLSCEAFVRPLAAYAVACALDDLLWTHGEPGAV